MSATDLVNRNDFAISFNRTIPCMHSMQLVLAWSNKGNRRIKHKTNKIVCIVHRRFIFNGFSLAAMDNKHVLANNWLRLKFKQNFFVEIAVIYDWLGMKMTHAFHLLLTLISHSCGWPRPNYCQFITIIIRFRESAETIVSNNSIGIIWWEIIIRHFQA